MMQRRRVTAGLAFNGTLDLACPWPLQDYGDARGKSCYGATMGWTGADPLMGVDGTPGGDRGEHDV